MSLNKGQEKAVSLALEHPVVIITGGPGVGKTFCARVVIEELLKKGHRIALCAPTGKAAKRLTEVTTYKATTIHRLLEPTMSPDGDFTFARHEMNPLAATCVLIDEASMVDVPLMYSLCRALNRGTKLVILGDVDQLPSVGPGNVLRDLITCGRIPVVRLTEIVRQAAGSMIIQNAHAINRGLNPRHPEGPGIPGERDRFDIHRLPLPGSTIPTWEEGRHFDFCLIKEVAEDEIIRAATELANAYDAQILVPMHAPQVGTKNLNREMQNRANPMRGGMRWLEGREVQWREGDKIMNLQNDAERGIFNGDIGIISKVEMEKGREKIECAFTGVGGGLIGGNGDDDDPGAKPRTIECKFSKQELHQLVHAWAMTIHKSQGSEWDHVVIPLHNSHSIMLQRNLLYTAVTRAKKMCWLIGGEGAIGKAVRTTTAGGRRTLLKAFMERELPALTPEVSGGEQEEFFGVMQ